MKERHKKSYAIKNMNIDCVVEYNPQEETIYDLSLKVLKHLFLKRLQYKKPVILGVFGKSGEGKSESTASLIEELMKVQGLDLKEYFDIINAFTPLQYSKKLNAIMFDKKYKDVKSIIIHEAREVIKAKHWYSFINVAISDINAMARSVKRVMTVIISQCLMDIDKSMRSTLTHYAKIERPNNPDLNAKMYLRIVYEDDTYMERPVLRRRKPRIRIIYPNKKTRIWIPNYIEIPRASKEIAKMLQEKDNEAKAPLLKKKLNQIQEEIKKEYGDDSVTTTRKNLVDFYTSDTQKFQQILKKNNKGWAVDKVFLSVLGIKKEEEKQFKKDILLAAVKKGYIENEEQKP